jgi:2-isopropylmalate synthase
MYSRMVGSRAGFLLPTKSFSWVPRVLRPSSRPIHSRGRYYSTSSAPKEKLIILDTTLRDGEQSPGVTLHVDEKLAIARQLSLLGVDVCEAGFPIASEGDFLSVKRISEEVGPLMEGRKEGKPMVIAALSRATQKDIDLAYDAVRAAPLPRIHTFLATSDIHLQYKLKISREECIKRAVAAVKYAKSKCPDVEFTPEDAGRTDRKFLLQVLAEVIKAGATTVNIADTVGYNTPEHYGELINFLVTNTEGADKVIWSCHCHNDLGLATANTLSGIRNGIRQAEVTINGIGERAGNTSLEETVMAINTHPTHFPVYTTIDTTQIYRTSQMVSAYTGMVIQPNKAIVGANAFAHESGIHQDGVLKHQATYEIMKPEMIGLGSNVMVIGKHSGRHAFTMHLKELGYTNLSDEQIQKAFERFKKLADTKKTVHKQDIHAILSDQLYQPSEFYKLKSIQVVSGTQSLATATVCISKHDGTEVQDAAIGDGPVDAVFKSINRIANVKNISKNILTDYEVKSVTSGSDALGEVTVRVSYPQTNGDTNGSVNGVNGNAAHHDEKPIVWHGHGVDEDILLASAKAYINALNRMLAYGPVETLTKMQAPI